MQYCEIQIEFDSSKAAPLHELLCAEQLSFQEADETTLNAPPPGRTRIHLFIPAEERSRVPELLVALREAASRNGPKDREPAPEAAAADVLIEVSERDEDEWRDNWKRFFSTRRIGRLAIVPSWEAAQHTPAADEVTLHLDPGRAFGTGGHESTRLCLRLLDRLRVQRPEDPEDLNGQSEPPDEAAAPQCSILDVGCGSGVLAIAALRIWPQAAGLAIDLDPEAIEVTLENAERNQVSARLRCETTPLQALPPSARFALVLANLTGPTLIELAEPLAARLDRGGLLLLSGILESEVNGVAARFAAQGLVETVRATEDEWAALQYLRPET